MPFLLAAACLGPAGWAETSALEARITEVQGIVQVRKDESAAWETARVDMVLGEGAEFRTGPKSAVRFVIPPDQTILLDRLGTVKLIEAVRAQDTVKTDLGMKYGRVHYDIEVGGLEHDATIHSPGATLAVRGTRVILYDQAPFTPQAVSLTGVARFRNSRNQIVSLAGQATVQSDESSVAENRLDTASMRAESIQQAQQQAREVAFLASAQSRTFGNVAASLTPVTDAQLPSLLGGHLDFVLRWSGPPDDFSDLNLVVRTPKGEIFGNPPFILSLYPNDPGVIKFLANNFPSASASGGAMGLNSIGPEGIEIASFSAKYPKGIYIISAYNFLPPAEGQTNTPGTGVKVPFKLEAFVDGKRQPVILNLQQALAGEEPVNFGKAYTGTLAIGEMGSTAVRIGAPASSTGGNANTPRASAAKPRKKP